MDSFLSKSEAAQLNRMRDLLDMLEDRAKMVAATQSSNEIFNLGRMAETISTAGDSIFAIQNVASAYLDCPNARASISTRLAAREQKRAELASA